MIPPSHLGPAARKAWIAARLAPSERIPGNAEKKRKALVQAVADQLNSEPPAKRVPEYQDS